jgi:hypothetical protein
MTAHALASSASTHSLTGIIVGVVVGGLIVALIRWRDSRRGAVPEAPDWAEIFPSRYGESTVVQRTITDAEAEELGKLILVFLIGLVGAIAFLSVHPSLMTWVAFFAVGLGIGISVGTLVLPLVGQPLAPSAGQAAVRAAIVSAIAGICLAWTLHTTYDQASLAKIRAAVIGTGFKHKPTALNHAFHSPGWWLVVSLGLGIMLAVMAALLAIWSALAALSMSRVGSGSRGRPALFSARFHTPEQAGQWVRAAILVVCAFVLCSGGILNWANPAAHIHVDTASTAHKPTPASTVTITANPTTSPTAVCGRISKLRVKDGTLLAALSKADAPALSSKTAEALKASTGPDAWFVTTGHSAAGVSCLYQVVAKPTKGLRIFYVDATALKKRTASAKKAHAPLVSAAAGGAQLPPHPGPAFSSAVTAALPSIRYG